MPQKESQPWDTKSDAVELSIEFFSLPTMNKHHRGPHVVCSMVQKSERKSAGTPTMRRHRSRVRPRLRMQLTGARGISRSLSQDIGSWRCLRLVVPRCMKIASMLTVVV